MLAFIGTLIIGIICIVIGISNMRGNISSLHSYHRHRVSEEDRIPFGKKVGFGTILCGCSISIFSVFSAITLYTSNNSFILIGSAFLLSGLIIGLIIMISAICKYNKGLF